MIYSKTFDFEWDALVRIKCFLFSVSIHLFFVHVYFSAILLCDVKTLNSSLEISLLDWKLDTSLHIYVLYFIVAKGIAFKMLLNGWQFYFG